MEIRLDNKRALVTGASSGIGEAVALTLAASGADIGLNYVAHPEAAQAVAQQIQAGGRRAFAVRADVSDPDAVREMFAKMDQEFGGIDILINNAGIDGGRMEAKEADLVAWRKVIEVNLFGAFYCSHEALKRMVPQKSGVILNLSSVHEVIPWSGYSAYAVSKAGLSMLTKTLAQEVAGLGIRVLAVGPGAIQTEINRPVWSNPESLQDLLEKIPAGRMGTSEEIANVVTVLVSDVAGYITGHTVFVDGGMTDYPLFRHGG